MLKGIDIDMSYKNAIYGEVYNEVCATKSKNRGTYRGENYTYKNRKQFNDNKTEISGKY